jgi:YHS domain-containing protein
LSYFRFEMREIMASKLFLRSGLGLSLAFSLGLIVAVEGCSSTDSDSANTQATAPDSEMPPQNAGDHDHAQHGQGVKTDMEKMSEALVSFSEEDRQSAMKQHICPVSGEMLGTMGAPQKVEVQGKTVWICCDGCKDKLLADPDKYLAKLN